MSYEEHFVKEDIAEFRVEGGLFKYKPVTAGDENEWLNEYMEVKDKRYVQNHAKLNKCKTRNLVEVPYVTPEKWKAMNEQERWGLLGRLKPGIFSDIIDSMNNVDSPSKKKT